MDRNEIDARLQKLRADLPSMLADAEDEEGFWPAFADEADLIEDGAISREDGRYVRNQLNRMLQQAGVPSVCEQGRWGAFTFGRLLSRNRLQAPIGSTTDLAADG